MNLPTRIIRFLARLVNPLRATVFCAACGKEIEGDPYVFDSKPWCNYFCIPAVERVHRAEVKREAAYRTAAGELPAAARKAGV